MVLDPSSWCHDGIWDFSFWTFPISITNNQQHRPVDECLYLVIVLVLHFVKYSLDDSIAMMVEMILVFSSQSVSPTLSTKDLYLVTVPGLRFVKYCLDESIAMMVLMILSLVLPVCITIPL